MDDSMPHVVKCLSDCGHDVVIDEVFIRDAILRNYAQCLHNELVYFVGIMCSLEELERRERMRGNRELGLARGQFDTIHRYADYYDIIVDTTDSDPTTCAQKIMDYIQNNPNPMGIKRLFKHFDNS